MRVTKAKFATQAAERINALIKEGVEVHFVPSKERISMLLLRGVHISSTNIVHLPISENDEPKKVLEKITLAETLLEETVEIQAYHDEVNRRFESQQNAINAMQEKHSKELNTLIDGFNEENLQFQSKSLVLFDSLVASSYLNARKNEEEEAERAYDSIKLGEKPGIQKIGGNREGFEKIPLTAEQIDSMVDHSPKGNLQQSPGMNAKAPHHN